MKADSRSAPTSGMVALTVALMTVIAAPAAAQQSQSTSDIAAEAARDTIVVGDTITGTFLFSTERDTIHIALTTADTIDIGMFRATGSVIDPTFIVLAPDGSHVTGVDDFDGPDAVLFGFTPASAGTYRIVAIAQAYSSLESNDYLLTVRNAGPILGIEPSWADFSCATCNWPMFMTAQQGGTAAVDTVWVYNAGRGTATWQMSSDAGWLTATPGTGSLTSAAPGPRSGGPISGEPAGEAGPSDPNDPRGLHLRSPSAAGVPPAGPALEVFTDRALAPAGAVAIELSADPTGLSAGSVVDTFSVSLTDDSWGLTHTRWVRLEFRVYDPRIAAVEDLSAYGWTVGIDKLETGEVLVSVNEDFSEAFLSDILALDTATSGVRWVKTDVDQWLAQVRTDPDTIMAGGDHGYHRFDSNGLDHAIGFTGAEPTSGARLPDGSLLVSTREAIYQVDGSDRYPVVWADNVITGIAYNPLDGMVYYSDRPEVRRFDPRTGETELVIDVGAWVVDIEVGRSGLLYLPTYDFDSAFGAGYILVTDRKGTVVDEYVLPSEWGYGGVYLDEGLLYATTYFNGGLVTIPVNDGPYVDGATYLVAEQVDALETVPDREVTGKVRVAATDGGAHDVTISNSSTWLTISATSGTTPLEVEVTANPLGLATGVHLDALTFTSTGLDNSPLQVPVRLSVEDGGMLALGDVYDGAVDALTDGDTLYVSVSAGDTLDVSVMGMDGLDPMLEVLDPSGRALARNDDFRRADALIPRLGITRTGVHALVVRGYGDGSTGRYQLKVRSSAPVVATDPLHAQVTGGPAGGTATDTIWVYNAGRGTETLSVSADVGWVTLNPLSTTLTPAPGDEVADLVAALEDAPKWGDGDEEEKERPAEEPGSMPAFEPAEAASPWNAPANAVAVEVVMDLSGFTAPGQRHSATLTFSGTDPWAGAAELALNVDLFDGAVEVVSGDRSTFTNGVAVEASGTVVMLKGESLVRVDPATGDETTLISSLIPSGWGGGLSIGPDGTMAAGEWSYPGTLRLIAPDLTVTEAHTADGPILDTDVALDGSVYFAIGAGARRLDPDGSVHRLPTEGGVTALTYDDAAAVLYYVQSGRYLHQLDMLTGETTYLRTLDAYGVYDLDRGDSGLLYGASSYTTNGMSPSLVVIDPLAGPDDLVVLPHPTYGVAVGAGQVYATGSLLRYAVSDSAPVLTGTHLLARSEDLGPRVVGSGGSATTTVNLTTSDGSIADAVPSTAATWISFVADTITTPGSLGINIDATALSAGITYRDTVYITAATASNSLAVAVAATVSDSFLAIGGAVDDTLSSFGYHQLTRYLSLAVGDTIDIGLSRGDSTDTDYFFGYLVLYDPDGAEVAFAYQNLPEDEALIAGYTPDVSGTYRLYAEVYRSSDGGPYRLDTRYSEPVVRVQNWIAASTPHGGGVVQDTLWIYNAGAGTGTWTATVEAPWLSLSTESGTLEPVDTEPELSPASGYPEPETGPSRAPGERPARPVFEVVRDPATIEGPARASGTLTPLIVSFDPSGLLQGRHMGQIVFRTGDSWDVETHVGASFQVTDPRLTTVVSDLPYSWGMTRLPDAQLLGTNPYTQQVIKIDPNAGSVRDVAPVKEGGFIEALAVRPSGAWVAADWTLSEVLALEPGQAPKVIWDAGASAPGGWAALEDIVVTPDDEIFVTTPHLAHQNTPLVRLSPEGVVQQIDGPELYIEAMAYDRAGDVIYAAGSAWDYDDWRYVLYQYYPRYDTWNRVLGVDPSDVGWLYASHMEVGESGLIYLLDWFTSRIFILDPGVVGSSYSPAEMEVPAAVSLPDGVIAGPVVPGYAAALVLGDNEMFISTTAGLFRLPVQDRAQRPIHSVAARAEAPEFVGLGGTVTATVRADMRPAGVGVLDFDAALAFDPAVLEFVSAAVGADFDGAFGSDAANAATGSVSFTGTGGATVPGDVQLVELTFNVVGEWGAESPLDLTVNQLMAVDSGSVMSQLSVPERRIVVSPGDFGLWIVADGDSVPKRDPLTIRVRMDQSGTLASLGAAEGAIRFDPDVVRVDSVKAGTFGGQVSAGLDEQWEGVVPWALANSVEPAADTVDIMVIYLSARTEAGDTAHLEVELLDALAADASTSILPFFPPLLSFGSRTAVGIWGDVDYTWRTDPAAAPVGARDALICLSAVVGKDVSRFDVVACDVAADSGEYTGRITAKDALIILNQVVGKDVTGHRVNQGRN